VPDLQGHGDDAAVRSAAMKLVKCTGKNGCVVMINPEMVCCVDVLPNHQGCAIVFPSYNVGVANSIDEVVALLGAEVIKTR
jgi:hypothetical protein